MSTENFLWLAIGGGVLAVIYGVVQTMALMRLSPGNARMQEIAAAIQEGAQAYLNRQYTTIGVVATNARLTKAQALRVAIMAQDGLARAMFPSHTPGDGDTIFVLATGALEGTANVSRVGSLGAEAVSDAILNAVLKAKGLPGYPSVADIKR